MTTGEVHMDGSPPVTWTFPGKYLSLTTYRRDGTAVATPVWFVQEGDRLLVRTGAASGKVKRIHRNPAVQVAACTARGRLRGQQESGIAHVLPGSEADAADRLITRRYRSDLLIIRPLWFVQSALHLGHPRSTPVILAITPR
jgi:PPOX class probable F420-dependent enzyme